MRERFFIFVYALFAAYWVVADPLITDPLPGEGTVAIEGISSLDQGNSSSERSSTNPEPISLPSLSYPMRSLCLNHDGVVKVRLKILPDGSVEKSEITDFSYGTLATFVTAEVKKWKFKPFSADNKETWASFKFTFTITKACTH